MASFNVSNLNGVFDFTSNLIEIRKYSSSAKTLFERAMLCSDEIEEGPESNIIRNMKALAVHEITHYTDLTTTLWGIEYLIRKSLLANAIASGECTDDARDVFLINVSELHAHEELLYSSGTGLLKTTKMNHEVTLDKRFGPIVLIHYHENDSLIQSVPLSMLAVLEANAYSNEVLSRIHDAERMTDPASKKLAYDEAEQDLHAILDNPDLSEYTTLISLASIHYRELTTKELMAFVSAIAKFTLDSNSIEMAAMANFMEWNINNRYAGKVISDDMRRGSSRALIFFKTILAMYDWMQLIEKKEKLQHLQLIRSDPHAAIANFWQEAGIKLYPDISSIEFDHCIEHLLSVCSSQDQLIFSESCNFNRTALKKRSTGSISLEEVQLLDLFLEDGEIASPPNRVDINIENYLTDHAITSEEIDNLCHKETAKKFYRLPDDPIIMIDLLGRTID